MIYVFPTLIVIALLAPLAQAAVCARVWRSSISSPWVFALVGAGAIYAIYWLVDAVVSATGPRVMYGAVLQRVPAGSGVAAGDADLGWLSVTAVGVLAGLLIFNHLVLLGLRRLIGGR